MKTFKFITFATAALVLAAACSSNNGQAGKVGAAGDSTATVNPKSLLPSKAETDSVSYLLGINFGSYLKGYDFGSDLNYAQIKKGMLDFLNAEGDQTDSNFVKQFKINPEEMNELFSSFLSKRHDYTVAVNKQKEAAYLASVEKADTLTKTASGLFYKINNPGDSTKIALEDTLFVHYVGTTPDGKVFDQVAPEARPATMFLQRVIPGWTEGLQLIGDHGNITLVIPSELAYGEGGTRGIDPCTTLHFTVQVDSVHRYVPKEPVATK